MSGDGVGTSEATYVCMRMMRMHVCVRGVCAWMDGCVDVCGCACSMYMYVYVYVYVHVYVYVNVYVHA